MTSKRLAFFGHCYGVWAKTGEYDVLLTKPEIWSRTMQIQDLHTIFHDSKIDCSLYSTVFLGVRLYTSCRRWKQLRSTSKFILYRRFETLFIPIVGELQSCCSVGHEPVIINKPASKPEKQPVTEEIEDQIFWHFVVFIPWSKPMVSWLFKSLRALQAAWNCCLKRSI